MEKLFVWGLSTLVSAFVGSFLPGYLRKKGENLATHEDLDNLVKLLLDELQRTQSQTMEADATLEFCEQRLELLSLSVCNEVQSLSTPYS